VARGYPTFVTGYYTREPVYGDLVRTALKLGYHVVPYESTVRAAPKKDDPLYAMNERERNQAQNLRDRILKQNPKAKILVHAGYGHIFEKKMGEDAIVTMAVRFKEITGIDPLTIDQVSMTQHSAPAYENGVYRYAADKGLLGDEALIFRDRSGAFYVPERFRGGYDLMVFHPRSRYEKGRPTWLRMNGARKPYPLTGDVRPPAGASCLVQAFHKNEDPAVAIPVDQVEVRSAGPIPALMLPSGDFLIRVVDTSGKTIREYNASTVSAFAGKR
jgi:hypothetical protein